MSVAAMGYGKIVSAIVQLALVPVMALKWGLPLYGQWLLLSAIPVFLAASDFGFSTAAGNRIIAEVARNDRRSALVTFQSAWAMIVALSAATGMIAAIACILLPARLLAAEGAMAAGDARTVLAVLCVYSIISLQMFLFAAVARSEGLQARSIALIASIQLTEGLAVLLVVWVGGSPVQVAGAYVLVQSTGLLVHIMMSCRAARWITFGMASASRSRIADLTRPAIAAMLLPLGQAGQLQGTAIAIGAAGGAAMVPLYTTLRTASRTGLQMMAIFVIPLMPEFTVAFSQGKRLRVARIGGVLTALNFAAGIAIGLVVALFGLDLLHVWTGGTIQPPQLMVTLTGISIALAVIWNPLGNLLLAINRHGTYSYIFVIASALSIALTYVLVGKMGVSGAAAAGLALEGMMLATVAISSRKNIGRLEMGREAFLAIVPRRWRRQAGNGFGKGRNE